MTMDADIDTDQDALASSRNDLAIVDRSTAVAERLSARRDLLFAGPLGLIAATFPFGFPVLPGAIVGGLVGLLTAAVWWRGRQCRAAVIRAMVEQPDRIAGVDARMLGKSVGGGERYGQLTVTLTDGQRAELVLPADQLPALVAAMTSRTPRLDSPELPVARLLDR
jgi:hypothetical protein